MSTSIDSVLRELIRNPPTLSPEFERNIRLTPKIDVLNGSESREEVIKILGCHMRAIHHKEQLNNQLIKTASYVSAYCTGGDCMKPTEWIDNTGRDCPSVEFFLLCSKLCKCGYHPMDFDAWCDSSLPGEDDFIHPCEDCCYTDEEDEEDEE